jgi:hypothetical protein
VTDFAIFLQHEMYGGLGGGPYSIMVVVHTESHGSLISNMITVSRDGEKWLLGTSP